MKRRRHFFRTSEEWVNASYSDTFDLHDRM